MKRIGIPIIALVVALASCARPEPVDVPGPIGAEERRGDEIVVGGQRFHTGTTVVLWDDPEGYNAYAGDTPHYSPRARGDQPASTLDDLRQTVDQFVLHYDAAGTSERCFEILHDRRGLSVHFLLDIDGTIYQTLDLSERAWHATKANNRSIGIEIASIGAYPPGDSAVLDRWYNSADFDRRLVLPASYGDGGVRTPNFVGRPARKQAVVGQVQGQWLKMYDLTNEQYEALAHLTATLCEVFPNLPCDYPRQRDGSLHAGVLDPEAFEAHRGLIGHFHVQENKVDPGPAFDWERLVQSARSLMGERRAGFSTRKDRLITSE